MTHFIEVTSSNNGRRFFLPINDFFHLYEPVVNSKTHSIIEYMQCVGLRHDAEEVDKQGVVFHLKETYNEVLELINNAKVIPEGESNSPYFERISNEMFKK